MPHPLGLLADSNPLLILEAFVTTMPYQPYFVYRPSSDPAVGREGVDKQSMLPYYVPHIPPREVDIDLLPLLELPEWWLHRLSFRLIVDLGYAPIEA